MTDTSQKKKFSSFEAFLTEERMDEIVQKMQQEYKQEEDFFKSSVYAEMVSAIKNVNYSLDSEYFAYNKEKVLDELGWTKYSQEEVDLFFSVVTSTSIGVSSKDIVQDYCSMFETYYIFKSGLIITVMHGQGTAFNISTYSEAQLPKILFHITGHSMLECKKALFSTNFDLKAADLYLAQGHWRAAKLISFDYDSLRKKAIELAEIHSNTSEHEIMEVLKNCAGNIIRADNMLSHGTPYPK